MSFFVGIDVHRKQWTVTIRHCGIAEKRSHPFVRLNAPCLIPPRAFTFSNGIQSSLWAFFRNVCSEALYFTQQMLYYFRTPLKNGFRRLFATGQIPIGKFFGGYLQTATLKSSCIVLFVHLLKNHPIDFIEIPINKLFINA